MVPKFPAARDQVCLPCWQCTHIVQHERALKESQLNWHLVVPWGILKTKDKGQITSGRFSFIRTFTLNLSQEVSRAFPLSTWAINEAVLAPLTAVAKRKERKRLRLKKRYWDSLCFGCLLQSCTSEYVKFSFCLRELGDGGCLGRSNMH